MRPISASLTPASSASSAPVSASMAAIVRPRGRLRPTIDGSDRRGRSGRSGQETLVAAGRRLARLVAALVAQVEVEVEGLEQAQELGRLPAADAGGPLHDHGHPAQGPVVGGEPVGLRGLLEGALDGVELVGGQPAPGQDQVGAAERRPAVAAEVALAVGHGSGTATSTVASSGPRARRARAAGRVPGRAPAAPAHRRQPAGGEPAEDGPVDPVAGHAPGRGRRGQGEEVLLGDRPEVEQADQAEADGRAVGDAELDAPPGQHGEGQAHAAAVADEPPDVAPVPLGVGVGQGEAADAGDGVAPEPGEHQPDPQDVVDAGGDHARHQADQGPLAPGRVAQAEQDHDREGRDDGVAEPVGQRHQPGERDPQRGDGREPEGQVEDPREQRRVGEEHPDRGQQLGVLGRRPPRRPAQRLGRRDRRTGPRGRSRGRALRRALAPRRGAGLGRCGRWGRPGLGAGGRTSSLVTVTFGSLLCRPRLVVHPTVGESFWAVPDSHRLLGRSAFPRLGASPP